jgi:hypothetical protein
MKRIELARFVAYLMASAGIGGLLGTSLEFLLGLPSWSGYVSALVFCGVGLIIVRKKQAINSFLSSPLKQHIAGRLSAVYNMLAGTIFLSPFALFIYQTLFGTVDFFTLSFAALCLFFLSKFIDYQTIITPRTVEAVIFSALFVLFSAIQLIVLPLGFSNLNVEQRNLISGGLTSSVVFTQGYWILVMLSASPNELPEHHPRLYYDEMPYRGMYNIIAGFSLMGMLYVNSIFSAKSLALSVLAGISTVFIAFVMAPCLRAFVKQRRRMSEIMTMHKYKKLADSIKKDNWENEVVSRSLIARFLNTISWSILTFSVFVGAYAIYHCLYTGDYAYFVSTLVLFLMIFTTAHYRIATKGERIQDLFTIFRSRKIYPAEIRRYTDLALIWYAICSGITLGFMIPMRSMGIENNVLTVGDIEITNLTLLTIFFVSTLIVVAYLSFFLFRRPGLSDWEKGSRRTLQILILLIGLSMVVSISVVLYSLLQSTPASIASAIATVLFLILFFRAMKSM